MRGRRRSGLGAGSAMLAVLLAGCAGGPEALPPISSSPPPPAPVANRQPAPKPRPPSPPPKPDPERLLGWTPAAVTALFGKPDLVRWEGPAQIYLYPDPAAGCVVTMLFREQEGAFRLESLTAHDPSAPDHAAVASKACLARLLPQRLWPRLAPERPRDAAMLSGTPEENGDAGITPAHPEEGEDDGKPAPSLPPQ